MKVNTAARLQQIMNEQNIKQIDIIKRCEPYSEKYNVKLTKNYLSQYVSGKVEPGQRTLSILAMALNVNEPWLMGFDVPRERNLIPQSEERPILKALYMPGFKDSDIANDFVMKKIADTMKFEPDDFTLLMEFKKLNQDGKKEAINRITELTFIPKYIEEYLNTKN